MRIDGEWLLCDDGIIHPVIRGEILTANGAWQQAEFFASALPTAMEIRHIADYRQPGVRQRQAERVVRLAGEFAEHLSKEILNA